MHEKVEKLFEKAMTAGAPEAALQYAQAGSLLASVMQEHRRRELAEEADKRDYAYRAAMQAQDAVQAGAKEALNEESAAPQTSNVLGAQPSRPLGESLYLVKTLLDNCQEVLDYLGCKLVFPTSPVNATDNAPQSFGTYTEQADILAQRLDIILIRLCQLRDSI